MQLIHCTHAANLCSALAVGLLPARGQGRRQAVYLARPAQARRVLAHVARRHGWPVSDLIILRADVPRSRLVRVRRGVYRTASTVLVY